MRLVFEPIGNAFELSKGQLAVIAWPRDTEATVPRIYLINEKEIMFWNDSFEFTVHIEGKCVLEYGPPKLERPR